MLCHLVQIIIAVTGNLKWQLHSELHSVLQTSMAAHPRTPYSWHPVPWEPNMLPQNTAVPRDESGCFNTEIWNDSFPQFAEEIKFMDKILPILNFFLIS